MLRATPHPIQPHTRLFSPTCPTLHRRRRCAEVHKLFPPEMLVHCMAAAAPWWPDTAALLRIVAEGLEGA